MIEVTVNRDGKVSTPSGSVFLGNKFENLDEALSFTFPDEFREYNKYLIGYHKRRKVTVILPINNDIFYVTTGLTYLDGDWTLYTMCRQQVLDLSADEEVDISPKEGEHVFISDGFNATVAANSIDASAINSIALDQNLQVIYEDLLKVKEELKEEQPIVIDLNIPMNLIDRHSGEIQRIELDDVKIDRNLFLDDEGKYKQFVNVRLSSSGVLLPYEFLCLFVRGTYNQINYCGSTIFWQPMINSIEYSNIFSLDFHENHDAENSFVLTLEVSPNLIAGEYPGFVKSAAGFDPEQHTVPVAIDGNGSMFVPIYPTLESLNAKPKDFVVNLSNDGGYSIDKTFDEIKEAYTSGKTVYVMFISSRMDLTYASDRQFKFSSIGSYYSYKELIVHSNSTIDYYNDTRTPDSSVYGLIRADRVNNDPNYTVSAKFNTKDGKLYVPTYPTLEKEWTLIDTLTYNQEDFADSLPVINKQYSGLDYTEICIVNDMKYSVPPTGDGPNGLYISINDKQLVSANSLFISINDKLVSGLSIFPAGGVCQLKYNGLYWEEKSFCFARIDLGINGRDQSGYLNTFNVGKCNKLSLTTDSDSIMPYLVTNNAEIESITFKIYAR